MKTFAEILTALNNGDHVTTPELKRFVKEATTVINLFVGCEAYRLVTTDLVVKRGAAQTYLATRQER